MWRLKARGEIVTEMGRSVLGINKKMLKVMTGNQNKSQADPRQQAAKMK